MPVIERSAVVPLPLEETWEAFFGEQMQNWVRFWRNTTLPRLRLPCWMGSKASWPITSRCGCC